MKKPICLLGNFFAGAALLFASGQAKEVKVSPPWTVIVLDENGKPKAGCEVTQDWEFVGLSEIHGSETKQTDQAGRVLFPARSAEVAAKEYLTSKIGEGLNVHGGFGPLVHVGPNVPDYKSNVQSTWDGSDPWDAVNPFCGKTIKRDGELVSTFRLLPAELPDVLNAHEWEKAKQMLKDNPKLATVSLPSFGTSLHVLAESWWSGSDHASQLELAHLLIDSGANVNAVGPGGTTPLHIAARHGSVPLVELLLSSGANPKATTPASMGGEGSFTPLHYLVSNMDHGKDADKIRIIDLLARHGADLNAPSSAGPPLMNAVVLAGPAVVKELLAQGADPSIPGNDGKTPLDYAILFQHAEVAKVLTDFIAAQKKQPGQ